MKEKVLSLAKAGFKRYSWAAAVLLAGVLLLATGSSCNGGRKDIEGTKNVELEEFDLDEFEDSLCGRLSEISGVGRVSLMLSLEETEEAVYAVNVRRTDGGSQSYESDLAVISDRSYGEAPVTLKRRLPSFRGAVVLCDGADDAKVRLAVTTAVSTVCGIGSDKVTVLKMDTGT